jgi:hypothetical protein
MVDHSNNNSGPVTQVLMLESDRSFFLHFYLKFNLNGKRMISCRIKKRGKLEVILSMSQNT